MAKITLDVLELPDRALEVMEWLAAGDKVVLTVGGRPTFLLGLTTNYPDPLAGNMPPRVLGMHPGAMTMTPDFNDPVSEAMADGPV
ncbi:MAG TPA: hypothetical protein VD866_22815 [Urbifossiella sp.]|nr:hypothetical protein [Urbifossiella sp.]